MRTVNFKLYTVDNLSSSESQGQSGPEKGATKVFRHKQMSPWVPTLTGTFQTIKWMLAPDWAQKMLCSIVPYLRTISPEFFS